MGVTIRDVATTAGVSPATVSRVYNRGELVSRETRERVEKAARRLNYIPNAAARSLSTNRTQAIGLIIPVPHSEYFMELMRGIDDTAIRWNYSLLISGSHSRLEHTRAALHMLTGRADGLIIVSPELEVREMLEMLPEGCPVVYLNAAVKDSEQHSFLIDNCKGSREAVRHLLALGHHRIAIVNGPEQNYDAIERRRGYRAALRESGIEPLLELEFSGDFSRQSGYDAGRRIVALAERPTAVFACNDYMGMGALSAFHSAGLRVPQDIAVIGFDDIPSAEFMSPALSSMRVPIYDMGRMAVERLVTLLEGQPFEQPASVVLSTRLIARASTAACCTETNGFSS